MARKPRIHVPGGFYHVMLRGNGGADIFFNDDDRFHFYLLLQVGIERFGHRVHAFCLMNNHVHLVIQVGDISLSRIMQNLSFRHTIWVNARQKRVGHLFQGRFKALLVDADSYLLELVRYTHLNPVRAGMVADPNAYAWSSHAAYLGKEALPWLETQDVLAQFSMQLDVARVRYIDFLSQAIDEGYRPEFHCGASDARVVGDDDFVQRLVAADDVGVQCGLDDCIALVCRCYALSESVLSERSRTRKPAEARAVIGWLMQRYGKCTLSDVAARFGRDVATLSTSVRGLEKRMMESNDLRKMIEQMERKITKK